MYPGALAADVATLRDDVVGIDGNLTTAAMAKALEELRARDDVAWTYISPAGDFQAEGERTGAYILGGEELTLNEAGESVISCADYAIAMVDEIESGDHVRQRISVVRK